MAVLTNRLGSSLPLDSEYVSLETWDDGVRRLLTLKISLRRLGGQPAVEASAQSVVLTASHSSFIEVPSTGLRVCVSFRLLATTCRQLVVSLLSVGCRLIVRQRASIIVVDHLTKWIADRTAPVSINTQRIH